MDLVFGVDGGLARSLGEESAREKQEHSNVNGNGHSHKQGHQSEVEVLSITLHAEGRATVDTEKLVKLLKSAPKDEVYRIKAILSASSAIPSSDEDTTDTITSESGRYILNWAFGRWTCTPLKISADEHESSSGIALRMTMILARYESTKWKKRLQSSGFLGLEGVHTGTLKIEKIG